MVVQGQRSPGGTAIRTMQGLGNNSEAIFGGRLNKLHRMTIVMLTDELPSRFP